ncbi:conjugation system SOS inhibitor PsiB (plasmid) [Edwardsiella anguillarum]|uniref:conjugation system SOS inhibitor PsiB n=1 Tax=Edwardsiella anguillarum TaxID=1821960 RepID=UPI0024B85D94|nr:conjugation system SOS inhibitor PsiB [Edwardsiella anguillarum]WHP89690.1 conjugation system SOS inhibitor PsiB [Edwardsiella anguillarum]
MRNIITLDVLKTMIPSEWEDYRASGEDFRRALTHAVMRDLNAPAQWSMSGEYRSEFGGFFPVQVRFTPTHGAFHVAVCSPGEVSPVWMMVFIPCQWPPFLPWFAHCWPIARRLSIIHSTSLRVSMPRGYSHNAIIDLLAMEGEL